MLEVPSRVSEAEEEAIESGTSQPSNEDRLRGFDSIVKIPRRFVDN